MSRVVDRVCRGSFTGAASATPSITMAHAQTQNLFNFTFEGTVAAFVQLKPQPEAHWNAYPSLGVSKLGVGSTGVHLQLSGETTFSKGALYFRIDDNGVQYTLNPTTGGNVQIGCPFGWSLAVGTFNRGTSRLYINGKKIGERTYTYVTGQDTPSADLVVQGAGGVGASSRVQRNCVHAHYLFDREISANEVFDWWTANIIPKGLVVHSSGDNFVSSALTFLQNLASSLIGFTVTSGTNLLQGVEVPM